MKSLNDSHIIAMVLQAAGWSLRDISDTVGLNQSYLSQLRTSPLYQQELESIRERMKHSMVEELTDRLLGGGAKALGVVEQILNDPNQPVGLRLRASVEWLDRIPQTSKVHRGQPLTAQPISITDEQVEVFRNTFARDRLAQEALQRARQILGPATDDLIDITPNEGSSDDIEDGPNDNGAETQHFDFSRFDDLIGI